MSISITIKERALSEAKKFLLMFLYLWIFLSLFALHKSLILAEPSLGPGLIRAIVNAFLLAKVMLVAEGFQLADNLKHKPLIYPIILKSAIFSLLLICFSILEEIAVGMWGGHTISDSLSGLGGGTFSAISIIGMILFVVLMPYFALKEIGRDIGDGKLYELFFLRRTKYVTRQFWAHSVCGSSTLYDPSP